MTTSLTLALVLLTTAAAGAEVTATRLDGRSVAGGVKSWDTSAVVISTDDGPVRIPDDELLSLRWPPPRSDEPIPSPLAPAVELIDGTCVPIDDYRREGESVKLRLNGSLPTEMQNATVRDDLVAAVRLQTLSPNASDQWDDIRAQPLASDVLVLAKREGRSLDTFEGTVGEVDEERIEFKIDGDSNRVNRDKVAGIVFYRAAGTSTADPLCIIHGRDGLRAAAAGLSVVDGVLHVTTTAGAKLAWPLDDVHFADFSAGKVVYLSDLTPLDTARTALVPVPAAADLAARFGEPRRDQSAFGGPLTLWFPGSDWHAPAGHVQSYSKGLALRSRTKQTYRIPSGYSRLLATAGIEPATGNHGAVRLSIVGDGRTLLDVDLAGQQAPVPIELDIAGVKRLSIVVDFGQNLDTGDWLNLCDVRIVK